MATSIGEGKCNYTSASELSYTQFASLVQYAFYGVFYIIKGFINQKVLLDFNCVGILVTVALLVYLRELEAAVVFCFAVSSRGEMR